MQTITNQILMIEPRNFGYNPETAENNSFQQLESKLTPDEIQANALSEFHKLVDLLRYSDIDVHIITDSNRPYKPDAIFPNNWISFHEGGTCITYPMYSPIRRQERRKEVINQIRANFNITKRVNYEHHEASGKYLEGTGSMVLDRKNRIAYAGLSPRTDPDLFRLFCREQEFQPVLFEACDNQGRLIYHTNVMMALAEEFVVICLESILSRKQREFVIDQIIRTKKKFLEISFEQMNSFAGNMLQVRNRHDIRYMILSEQAYLSLDSNQVSLIHDSSTILNAPIYTIEKIGGGSVRCMMAEIFLPIMQ